MALSLQTAHRKDLNLSITGMQHRHFAAIAAIIRRLPADVYGPEQVAEIFADQLRFTNPNFDRDRFLRACAG